jgi:Domain of unknown function (DUF222)
MGVPGGQLDPLTYATLEAALDHYAAPTPAQSDDAGRVLFADDRTPAQRRCDALGEIAHRALAAAGEPTGDGEGPGVTATRAGFGDYRGAPSRCRLTAARARACRRRRTAGRGALA